MTSDAMPWVGAPDCEWTRNRATRPCGQPATHHITMHDVLADDPKAPPRLWIMCLDCALDVLQWAQREHQAGNGIFCHGCDSLIGPMLGGFILGHGELAHPDKDVTYGH